MIKAQQLLDITETDYQVILKLMEIYEDILYVNNMGRGKTAKYIGDLEQDVLEGIKLDLVNNGYVVEIKEDILQVKW